MNAMVSLALRAIHLVSRLRRVADMCSSRVSGIAYRLSNGRTLCAPTEEKILCRSPFRSSRRSLIFARLGIKETGFTRVETLVSILVPTAVGAATFPPPAGSNSNPIYRMKKILNPT